MPDSNEKTNCYTYKVEMIVQVLGKDQPTALRKLDTEGGYLTSRKVTLQKTVPLFYEENKQNTV